MTGTGSELDRLIGVDIFRGRVTETELELAAAEDRIIWIRNIDRTGKGPVGYTEMLKS